MEKKNKKFKAQKKCIKLMDTNLTKLYQRLKNSS